MTEHLDKYVLKNGMVLLGERMKNVESVAFDFMLPAGAARLSEGCCGAANVIEDWIFRGAADKDSKQLGDCLDGLGLHRDSSVGSSYLTIGAALEAENLSQALDLYADVILRSHLKDEQFELARQSAIESVLALDDDPRQKVMLLLREQFYPSPLGRSTVGDKEQLKALTCQQVRQIAKEDLNLSQTIFSVAGKYDFDGLCKQMEKLFDSGEQKPLAPIELKAKMNKYKHIHNDGAQVHIAVMTKTVKPDDEDYYNATYLGIVTRKLDELNYIYKLKERNGHGYFIQA